MVFDDTNGTYQGNDLYQTIFRRRTPLQLTRDNSGFTPTYVQPSLPAHTLIVAIGIVLFAWLVIGHVRVK